ncbi:hypothetical protein M5689_003505 [Euphorbia peplus]|nr:hypothetical protein M5689_003505 [Euphorbia peplus]
MTQSSKETASVATSNDVKEVDGPKLGSKRALTSHVWDHFDRVTINGVLKAICNYCKKQLRGDGQAGTSHLSTYMRVCRTKKNGDIKQAVLKMQQDSQGKTLIGSALNFDPENSRLKLARMIAMHELPFSDD